MSDDDDMNAAAWLRSLARSYSDGVAGMEPADHPAWDIANEIDRLRAINAKLVEALEALIDPKNEAIEHDAWAHKLRNDARAAIAKAKAELFP
jgi:hypothetical protein